MRKAFKIYRFTLSGILAMCLFFTLNIVYANSLNNDNSIIHSDAKIHYHERYQPRLGKTTESANIIPLQERVSKDPGLDHIVFGFLPWWMLNTVETTIDLDLLTHIAIFDFACDINGNYITDVYGDTTGYPVGWPNDWENLLNRAHAKGVKLLMSISSLDFSKDIMNNILNDTSAADNLIRNTEKVIRRYNLDGVIINFEHPYDGDKGEVMNRFVRRLNNYLKNNIGQEQVVTFAAPPINWGNLWDLPGLIDATDFLVIMGYDFWWSGSEDTGPCAPIFGGNYNILKTLDNLETGYGYCDHSKIVLVYPYYGFTWEVNENQRSIPHAVTLSTGTHIVYSSIIPKYREHGIYWDPSTEEPFTYYQQGNKWYQSWCDNVISLSNKQKLIHDYGLLGTGMWALGYDGSNRELWNVLKENYYVFSSSLDMDNFENGSIGRFYREPTYSGSTQGVSHDSYTEITSETSSEGNSSLKITLIDDNSSRLNWETRLLSGTGRPDKNAAIPQSYYLKFSAKTDRSDMQIAVLIDDRKGELETSPRISIKGDNKWHEYSIKLDNSTSWDSYENGNTTIDSSYVSLDALLICAPDAGINRTLYLDNIKAEETGEASEPGESVHTLFSAYPNPINTSTNIAYELSTNAKVKISVYDLKGRKTQDLVNSEKNAGNYNIIWSTNSYMSGIYFIHMMVDNKHVDVEKVTIIK